MFRGSWSIDCTIMLCTQNNIMKTFECASIGRASVPQRSSARKQSSLRALPAVTKAVRGRCGHKSCFHLEQPRWHIRLQASSCLTCWGLLHNNAQRWNALKVGPSCSSVMGVGLRDVYPKGDPRTMRPEWLPSRRELTNDIGNLRQSGGNAGLNP